MNNTDYEIANGESYVCPHCKYEGEYTGDRNYSDGDMIDEVCNGCGEEFEIQVNISVDHHCYKKDVEDKENAQ